MRIAAIAALLAGFSLYSGVRPAPKPLRIPIEQYKLDNGLRIVMSVDHSAPTYGISITYNVGSHNERAGRTGFAHLFEHMMFEGSENVGKGEHMILVENNGGNMNGTTTEDRTNYFESFASNQLDLGLFLEVGPHALAGGEPGQPGQPAQRGAGGAPAGRRQSALRRNRRKSCKTWSTTTSPTSIR